MHQLIIYFFQIIQAFLKRANSIVLIFISITFISACEHQVATKRITDFKPNDLSKYNSIDDVAIILEGAEYLPNDGVRWLLKACVLYIDDSQPYAAEYVVQKIDISEVRRSIDSILSYMYCSVKVPLAVDNMEGALERLRWLDEQFNINYELMLGQKGLVKLLMLRSDVYYVNQMFLDAFKERVKLNKLLTVEEKTENHKQIWQILTGMSQQELRSFFTKESDREIKGWLSLAFLDLAYQFDIEFKLQALNNWLKKWPAHSAASLLPKSLLMLDQLVKKRAKKVAILLPMSGALAEVSAAIRKGLLAAYYHVMGQRGGVPILAFYDTEKKEGNVWLEVDNGSKSSEEKGQQRINQDVSEELLENANFQQDMAVLSDFENQELSKDEISVNKSNNISSRSAVVTDSQFMTVYKKAVDEGSEFIIGPLKKNHIRELAALSEKLPVPTLALNYIDTVDVAPTENLYQFGLAPESEVDFLIDYLGRLNYRQVAIITPDTLWGERLSSYFTNQWVSQSDHYKVVSTVSYAPGDNPSVYLKKLLGVDQSESRAQRLQSLTDQRLEFTPRRRKDIDFIFLVANPSAGRQINPMLSFHYASDIPVFSTSHINNGWLSEENKDLNKIYFPEMPWILGHITDVKLTFNKAWPEMKKRYNRIYALGVDAFRLYDKIPLLQAIDSSSIYGETGSIRFKHNKRQLQRKLVMAKFVKNEVVSVGGGVAEDEP